MSVTDFGNESFRLLHSPNKSPAPKKVSSNRSKGEGGRSGRSAKERMEQLSGLLGGGLITQDEFDAKRKQILDGI